MDKDGANPPSDPVKISPQKGGLEVAVGKGGKGGDTVLLPAFSYVVVEYKR